MWVNTLISKTHPHRNVSAFGFLIHLSNKIAPFSNRILVGDTKDVLGIC